MYCTNCGAQLAPDATTCASCGHPVRRFPPPPAVPNYLVASILITLCCCPPFGLVAVVYAAKVNTRLGAGDVAGAQAASNKARMWMWIGVIAGILTGGSSALVWFLG